MKIYVKPRAKVSVLKDDVMIMAASGTPSSHEEEGSKEQLGKMRLPDPVESTESSPKNIWEED